MIKRCPAVLIHIVLAIVVITLAAVLSSQVKADERLSALCTRVESLAHVIMETRVQGQSFARSFDEIQTLEGGDFAHFTFLVTEAYNSPLTQFTATTPADIASEFAAYARLDCTLNWGPGAIEATSRKSQPDYMAL